MFTAMLAALTVVLQAAGGALPGIGYFFSPFASVPILLGTLISFRAGVSTYSLTIFLLLLIQPSELVIFPFTTGLLGLGLGWALRTLNRRLGILFVNDVDKDNIRVMNCEYDEIFVKDEEGKYVGKYKALESYDEHIDLLQYRRYKKEKFNSPCAFVIHDIKVNSIKPFFMSGIMKQIGFDDSSI